MVVLSRGVNFVNLTDVGDPVDSARAYYEAGCDELVFLDITATSDNRETTVDMVRRVADRLPRSGARKTKDSFPR